MNKNKWFLNGGRGSGRTLRFLCETYENKIANLEEKLANADYQLEGRDNEIRELKEQLQWECDTKAELAEHLGKANDKIEKMKCCANCRHSRTEYDHCRTDKHEKCEIKEK